MWEISLEALSRLSGTLSKYPPSLRAAPTLDIRDGREECRTGGWTLKEVNHHSLVRLRMTVLLKPACHFWRLSENRILNLFAAAMVIDSGRAAVEVWQDGLAVVRFRVRVPRRAV